MTKLSVDQITHLATLARIGLDSEDLANLTLQLSAILNFVEALEKIDTSDTLETSQVTGLTDVTRADEVKPCRMSQKQLLANAPLTDDGYIKVKRVIN